MDLNYHHRRQGGWLMPLANFGHEPHPNISKLHASLKLQGVGWVDCITKHAIVRTLGQVWVQLQEPRHRDTIQTHPPLVGEHQGKQKTNNESTNNYVSTPVGASLTVGMLSSCICIFPFLRCCFPSLSLFSFHSSTFTFTASRPFLPSNGICNPLSSPNSSFFNVLYELFTITSDDPFCV